jgi:hypothetical protein
VYSIVLTVHSVLRWLVIAAGCAAAFRAFNAWSLRRPWTRPDHVGGALFVGVLDLQVLVGLVLYIFLSPMTSAAFRNMDAAMANRAMRFWTVEHASLMLVAAALAHVGRARVKRAHGDAARHRQAALFYTLALVAVLLAIPWPFLPYGRPLF